MKSIQIISIVVFSIVLVSFAQVTFPINGITDSREDCYLFRNATIVVSPTETIEKGSYLLERVIEAVGVSIDACRWLF